MKRHPASEGPAVPVPPHLAMRKPPVRMLCAALCAAAMHVVSAQQLTPDYQRDRGPGVTTSLFGTYIRENQWLVYPFYEYEKNTDDEYKGSELGFSNDAIDYLGRSSLHQGLLFVGYGLTEDVALELEFAFYESKVLQRAPNDTTSGMPARLEESGFGEFGAQLRWRFIDETAGRPEWFTFLELGIPVQSNKRLIGNPNWDGVVGIGVVKGFNWGTLTARASIEYNDADKKVETGEWAVEYLKRLSDKWRIVTTLEGESDELSLIGELQWHVTPEIFFKFNSGFGLTSKAPDVAPEIGVMVSF